MIEAGSRAPDFELQASDGTFFRLSSLRGRIIVLYFYPRAFTPGCSREAERFNEMLEEFAGMGAVVVGISTDPLDRVAGFKDKLGLKFTLLSDPEGKVASLYGVLRQGRRRVSAERTTFIIDGGGVVRAVLRNVRPAEKHVDLALEQVRRLAGERQPS